MERKNLIESIVYYDSIFIEQVKNHLAMGLPDLVLHAENAYIPILNIVFGVELVNANLIQSNHPALDLIDEQKGIAFQVTATATQRKVEETIKKFVDHEMYNKCSILYHFILTDKKSAYNSAKINNVLNGTIHFDVKKHIIDRRDVLKFIYNVNPVIKLQEIARLYEQLTTMPARGFSKFIQNRQDLADARKPDELPFIHQIRRELKEEIGEDNVNKVPELSTLFQKMEELNEAIENKKEELNYYQKIISRISKSGPEMELVIRSFDLLSNEYEKLKIDLEQKKTETNDLSNSIKRQKEFLDTIDKKTASERMKKAKELFDAGEFSSVNELLNYEGREKYIQDKLNEKEKLADEYTSLANEEVFIALSMMQKIDWKNNVELIDGHFERSIELGGYGYNAYQYSFFLENIDQVEKALAILDKVIAHFPEDELASRALVFKRMGILLDSINAKEEALKNYLESTLIYEVLFQDNAEFWIELADVLYRCGSLLAHEDPGEARLYLERALLLLGSQESPGNFRTLQLSYFTCIALGYLHLQRGDISQVISYQRLALNVGAMLAMYEPEEGSRYLVAAVQRYRMLLGEEIEGKSTFLFFGIALKFYLKFNQEHSLEKNYNNAKALCDLGMRLLVDQEVTGADICFRNALKIFKKLYERGYSCLYEVADSLHWTGFRYMVKNNVKARKKVLLEALKVSRKFADTDPVMGLPLVASILNDLYLNSFIAVPSSLYYRAVPYFKESLDVYKKLDNIYQKPNWKGWLQLLTHQSTLISKGLDKTPVLNCYTELVFLKGRIPVQELVNFEETLQLAIHEMGELILNDLSITEPGSQQIFDEIVTARTILYNKDQEKYRYFLLNAVWKIGSMFYNAERWKESCVFLQRTVELIKELNSTDASVSDEFIVMPLTNLAIACGKDKDHATSALHFIELSTYFESKLPERPDYLNVYMRILVLTTEELFLSGQYHTAKTYMSRIKEHLPYISDPSDKIDLKKTYAQLKKEYT